MHDEANFPRRKFQRLLGELLDLRAIVEVSANGDRPPPERNGILNDGVRPFSAR